ERRTCSLLPRSKPKRTGARLAPADDQHAWDWKYVASVGLSKLPAERAGIDWSLLGFDQDELAKLLGGEVQEGLTDPDEVPEPPDEAVTQRGDLWILRSEDGREHRLLCGDSASAADVDRLLASADEPGSI